MIGLITVHQMQLAGRRYEIRQQEIHPVPFNFSQEVTTVEEDGAPRSNSSFLRVNKCHSNGHPYNQAKDTLQNIHPQSKGTLC